MGFGPVGLRCRMLGCRISVSESIVALRQMECGLYGDLLITYTQSHILSTQGGL